MVSVRCIVTQALLVHATSMTTVATYTKRARPGGARGGEQGRAWRRWRAWGETVTARRAPSG